MVAGSGEFTTIGRLCDDDQAAFGRHVRRGFLAYDTELNRRVAINIPYSSRIADPKDFEDFVYEARILAGLDHGAIVPVYDIGRMQDGRCYIVSKFVDGVQPGPAAAATIGRHRDRGRLDRDGRRGPEFRARPFGDPS